MRQGASKSRSTAAATATARRRRWAATKSATKTARTKSEPSFFSSKAPAKQKVGKSQGPALVRDEPPAGRCDTDGEHEGQRQIRVRGQQLVEDRRREGDREQRQPQDEGMGSVPEQRKQRQQRGHQEEQELDVQETCVERAHRAKVDRFERRQQQRVVEIREAVGRAGEEDGIGPAEGVERMALERPDRPGVVAVQGRDAESSRVVDEDGEQRGDPDQVEHGGPPSRTGPVGAVKPPQAGAQPDCGECNEADPAEANVHERKVRREDSGEQDSREVGECASLHERTP